MWPSLDWKSYELVDASHGARLERWSEYYLVRPDPQVIWQGAREHARWGNPHAAYAHGDGGQGSWNKHKLPPSWLMDYKDLRFECRPMSFKHTGLFPEQASNWDTLRALIAGKPKTVLCLFAYTGAATVAAAKAGAKVTHVDASKGIVDWAKKNAALNGVSARFLVDDCVKFAERERRRGSKYHGVVLDPPSYGRGPRGEIWKLEDSLHNLLCLIADILRARDSFVLVNSYTAGVTPSTLEYLLSSVFTPRFGGSAHAGELGLPVKTTGLYLPCGATGKWIHS
ncbi:MAG: class I SAM-dependent methyltransferase [Oscillospiraceae bacterium]|jgi:23S rRNA (cytosine1962-C5)-methyltransferase|nr:class I SAM-dependent methyltransferase [Oscillospiraceae bacterium]